MMWKNFILAFALFIIPPAYAQVDSYGVHQPYASHWFVEDLLKWSPETDSNAVFNVSYIRLAERFTTRNSTEKTPGIISLIAPHSTSKHPSQGFSSVKQYAFPYWQYIDYFVQWGGSANEGIVVPPLATWTDAAHKNGVKSIGTVFFPPNVYGGKPEWVYEFLKTTKEGNFPAADKLIQVAKTYKFDGWFINQETYELKQGTAEKMEAFMAYYKKKSDLKLVWYDAMIADSRVIWQDELNEHNALFFQKDNQTISDVFFINFRYHEINLEDSKKKAHALNRSEWDLFAGIDVQGRSFETPVQWNVLFGKNAPKNTSIGLYWPNSTFDLSATKEPEDVYDNEQKFWLGGTETDGRFGKRKWEGFSPYFEPRSVITSLPFKTNFNYGLGRFYNKKGVTVSRKEWHNLSIQDILPTYQWKADTLKVKPSINFKDSYEGGNCIQFISKGNAEVPLYKTAIALSEAVTFDVVSKSVNGLTIEFYCNLSNGEKRKFTLHKASDWKRNSFKLKAKKGVFITQIGVQTEGDGTAWLGEIKVYHKREQKLPAPKFTIELFLNEGSPEAYIHFDDSAAFYHEISAVDALGKKIWLGKTPSKDFYIANVPLNNGNIHFIVSPISIAGEHGVSTTKKIPFQR